MTAGLGRSWQSSAARISYGRVSWDEHYKVVPPNDSIQLVQITPITMVFAGDISIVNGIINQLITGGHHLV